MQSQPFDQISGWGAAAIASVTGALAMVMNAIPRLIGFAVILLIGWFIASALAKAVAAGLRALNFNDMAHRSGLATFVRNTGVHTDSSGVIALTAKWFVRLIALMVAFDALGLPAVSEVLRQLLLWLPNLVVALVVLVVGGLAANALAGLVRGATAQGGFTNPDLVATIARVAVWAFAIVVAVNQIGIATTLINTLLIGVVGSIALASGLAFGLGGREIAHDALRRWYDEGRNADRKLDRAADAAVERASEALSDRVTYPPRPPL